MEYKIIEQFTLRSDVVLGDQTVPLFDLDAFDGLTTSFVDEHPPVDEIKIDGIPRCDGAMHVKGKSMYPLLMPGDIVLFKTVPNRRGGLFFGEMYLLALDLDGEECITIKYVHQSERVGYYRLESYNPDYPPREVPVDKVRSMALVKASVRPISSVEK